MCSCRRQPLRLHCRHGLPFWLGIGAVWVFFEELADLLDAVATRAEPVYLVGDLNIRLDRVDDVNAVRLVDLLSGYGLNIQVSVLHTSSAGCST